MIIFGTSKQFFVKTFWFQKKRTPETYTETKQVPDVHYFFSLLAIVNCAAVESTTIDKYGALVQYNTDLKADIEKHTLNFWFMYMTHIEEKTGT